VIVLAGVLAMVSVPLAQGGDPQAKKIEDLCKPCEVVKPLLPPGTPVSPRFEPGKTPPIGTVQMVQGQLLSMHPDDPNAYRLEKGYPVFSGDTLVTGQRSSANVILNNRSVFSLAAESKLVIDKHLYDPSSENRSSLMNLVFGRARFMVKKVKGDSDIKIKTQTAVLGVRGSDFALVTCPFDQRPHTTLVTGEETRVSYQGEKDPPREIGPCWICPVDLNGNIIEDQCSGISCALALALLEQIGLNLASISMPPGFE
jgi:hypothetical protein